MNFSLIDIVVVMMTGIRILERTFFHTYKWQLKEYRWDRYREYLRARQGIWALLHPWYWFGWTITLLLLFASQQLYNILRFPWFYLIPLYVSVSGIIVILRVLQKKIRRPEFTGRAMVITIFSILISIAPFYFALPIDISTFAPFLFIISLLLTPFIVIFFVFFTSFPVNHFKRRTIKKAKEKMASLSNVKVIGITGSYGKSSTKEFLATILSAKYKVAKTPANRNSEIGVAQTVLRDLKSEHEIFIVEMGAYRVGEIKAICDIVHPTIGVLTAISEQHLALFGSIEETKRAKYELIESLLEDGTAIFNADNRASRELAEQTLKLKKLYSTERPADISATAITVQPEKLSFSLTVEGQKQHIVVSMLGAHAVSNLLAAITVAQTLGMTLPEIAEAIQQITPLDHTLKPYHHKSGALIIDDSYSANPNGVVAALTHLKLIPRKYKVLVMMPMIELGSAAKDAHRRVGERVGEVCDLAIFTQKNFFGTLRKASKLPNEKILVLSRPQSILNALTPYLNENSVILLENRIPSAVLKSLI